MRYLLDTSVVIWYLEGYNHVPNKIKTILRDPQNILYISIVSAWEITIKLCVKKLDIHFSLDDLFETIKAKNFKLLPIKQKHLNINLDLQMLHNDPFDRLLIATAKSEKLTIITSDRNIHRYDVDSIW